MTYTEANDLWVSYLKGGEYPAANVIKEMCNTWNSEAHRLRVNWLGGKGFHIKDGRIKINDKNDTIEAYTL